MRRSTGTPPRSTSIVTAERSRGQRTGARMFGGNLANSAALCTLQSDTGLPVWAKLILITA